jgi:hypothetical protein
MNRNKPEYNINEFLKLSAQYFGLDDQAVLYEMQYYNFVPLSSLQEQTAQMPFVYAHS